MPLPDRSCQPRYRFRRADRFDEVTYRTRRPRRQLARQPQQPQRWDSDDNGDLWSASSTGTAIGTASPTGRSLILRNRPAAVDADGDGIGAGTRSTGTTPQHRLPDGTSVTNWSNRLGRRRHLPCSTPTPDADDIPDGWGGTAFSIRPTTAIATWSTARPAIPTTTGLQSLVEYLFRRPIPAIRPLRR